MAYSLIISSFILITHICLIFQQGGNPELENSLSHSHGNSVVNGAEKQSAHQMSLSEQQLQTVTIEVPLVKKNGNIVDSSPSLESSNKTIGMDSHSYIPSSLSSMDEALENGKSTELNMKKSQERTVGEHSHDNSTSILDKLFGAPLTVASGGSSSLIEVIFTDSMNSINSSFCLLIILIVSLGVSYLRPSRLVNLNVARRLIDV